MSLYLARMKAGANRHQLLRPQMVAALLWLGQRNLTTAGTPVIQQPPPVLLADFYEPFSSSSYTVC